MIVTEAEAEKIDEEWSVAQGAHDEYLKQNWERAAERERLAKRFGREPGENDVQWEILNN